MKKIILLATGIVLFSCANDEITEDQNLIDEIESSILPEDAPSDKTSLSANKDTDNDGINDEADADVDGDGTLDNGTDSDGDGINDLADVDNDNDGIDDNGTDIDEDGINDAYDDDIDGDGIDNEEDEYQSLSDTALSPAVQQKITEYIDLNHSGKTITEVEIENQTIEVELSGNIELSFTLEGDFVIAEVENENEGINEDGDHDESDENEDGDHDENGENEDGDNDENGENEENEYSTLAASTLSAAVQQKITAYINANYPNTTVIEVDVEGQRIEVELSNNVELIFDSNGNFLRLDD
ncbi:MAG: PepSY-like domain-containing protein [Flavobacteriaceae bacterium]